MSHNYFAPNWTEKITLPVKRVDAHWEFFYGGDVPVQDGCLAELTIDVSCITDPEFLKRTNQKLEVKVLPVGSPLLVALSDRNQARTRIGPWPEASREDIPNGTTRFEKVWVGPPKETQQNLLQEDRSGGLWLRLKGLERTEIRSSTIVMPPGFPTATASSLNHAFTLLSKEYETHRISNTGNVYKQCFYQEKNGKWYPLNDLRHGVQVKGERALLASAWTEIEKALGWRPTDKKPRKS